MDPNATWVLILEKFRVLETNPNDRISRVRAARLLETLAEWIRKGGFPPKLGD
jgi:hypothetical protein